MQIKCFGMEKIGFGGSCHWCTEAVFQSLLGVTEVLQGWISIEEDSFSEAVILYYDSEKITLEALIQVHLHTHSCTSEHSMRGKYRSAIYTFDPLQSHTALDILQRQQIDFVAPIITRVLTASVFKLNEPQYLNYYFSDPSKPFCENIVNPKLSALLKRFNGLVDENKLAHLIES